MILLKSRRPPRGRKERPNKMRASRYRTLASSPGDEDNAISTMPFHPCTEAIPIIAAEARSRSLVP